MDTEWYWEDYEDDASTISTIDLTEYHKAQLATAVGQNKVEDLKLLLDTGGGINFTDAGKYTLIHYAVKRDKLEVLELLLNTDGAPIDAEDRDIQDTALLLAIRESKEPLAMKLIEKGADVNLVDCVGDSPLIISVCANFFQISKLLIEKGANINCRNNDGVTPLLVACRNNWVDIVHMLLYYGADATVPTKISQSTPFLVASSEVQEILFDFIFDGEKIPVDLPILVNAMVSDSPLLEKLFQNVSEVLYNRTRLYVISSKIPEMNPHYLTVFIDRFEKAMTDLILRGDFLEIFVAHLEAKFYSYELMSRAIQNLGLLVDSPMVSYVVKAINRTTGSTCQTFSLGDLFYRLDWASGNQLQHLMDTTSRLLAQGVQINQFDVSMVYLKCGYCPLFKQMIAMDDSTKDVHGKKKHLMPQLICDVKMTIQEFLLTTDNYDLNSLDHVFDYFCHQGLKQFCLQLNGKMEMKVKELPDVPLLVELARNVSRNYLLDIYKIKNFRQFVGVLEALPIPEKLRKILTYEEKLYVVK